MKLIFKILVTTLIIAIVGLFMSCGARHVKKSESKEEIKTELTDNSTTEKQVESNIKIETKTNINDKNEITSKEDSYEPIDPTKEASLVDENGKKTILNNLKKITKTETKKNNTQIVAAESKTESKKEAVKEQKAIKQVSASKKENKAKEVKKEPFNPLRLLYIIIPIFIIYIIYRKYKQLPLVPKF